MFDSLTLATLRSDAVEFANDIAYNRELDNAKEILEIAIDRLCVRLHDVKTDVDFLFDDLTGRNLGKNAESVAKKLEEEQEKAAKLRVQIAHLCVLHSKQK